MAIDWAILVPALAAPGLAWRWWGVWGLSVLPFAILVIGNRQHALGVLGHEGAHRLIAPRNRALNDGLTQVLCFWPLLADVNVYRGFHLAHHHKLNTPEDPENAYREAGAPHWDLPYTRAKLLRRCTLDALGGGFGEAWRIRRFMGPQSVFAAAGPITCALAITAVGAAFGHPWVVVLWYWSLGTTFVALWRARCWFEHAGVEHTHRLHLNLWQRHLVSPHNIWIHWEHHTLAGVPWWALPELREQAPEVPVITLDELFAFYEQHPRAPSGTPSRPAAGAQPS